MIIEPHKSDQLDAWYDDTEKILHVEYRGVLTPEITSRFYQWLGKVMQEHPEEVKVARGSIFDFRQVTGFDNRNLTSAQRQSQQVNQRFDLSGHPVALLVKTLLQEQILQVELKISPQQGRKKLVHTDDEARAFINSFYSVDSGQSSVVRKEMESTES